VKQRDLQRFEKKLIAERETLLKQLGIHQQSLSSKSQRDSSGDLSAYSYHMADLGSDAMEREKEFHVASAEHRMLREIDDALRKIHNKEYGQCEICGQTIPRERLEIMPQARLCIRCQEEEDKREGVS